MSNRKLDVYLNELKVGVLTEKADGNLNFKYEKDAFLDSPISLRLPVRERAYNDKECRPFFENLLPEGDIRTVVAKKEGVSANNTFSLLDKIGGDCAGAISLYEPGTKSDSDEPLEEITGEKLYKILSEQKTSPLLTDENIRLSLAGAQSKFAVYIKSDQWGRHFIPDVWYFPNKTNFSTHLIKPENKDWNSLVVNEYFCMSLANHLDFMVAPVQLIKIKDKTALLIRRYDRTELGFKEKKDRIHQEDFCQLLGYTSDRKYQKENGPTFKDCFKFIKENTELRYAGEFIRMLIFNYLIGNCDAHAKNFSVLHIPITRTAGAKFINKPWIWENRVYLAPFYDLVSTDAYDNLSKEMAMKIGSTWNLNEIQKADFYKLATENGVKEREIDSLIKGFANILTYAEEIKEDIKAQGFDNSICDTIINGIKKRLERLNS